MEALDPQHLAAIIERVENVTLHGNTGADLRFLLHVRNDVPVLIAEVKRLATENERLRMRLAENHEERRAHRDMRKGPT